MGVSVLFLDPRSDGNLYGTAYKGGAVFGTVFKLTTNGAITTLYNFSGGADGGLPYAGLTQGHDGKFYGTTYKGGTSGYGTIFQITTNGALTTFTSFATPTEQTHMPACSPRVMGIYTVLPPRAETLVTG